MNRYEDRGENAHMTHQTHQLGSTQRRASGVYTVTDEDVAAARLAIATGLPGTCTGFVVEIARSSVMVTVGADGVG